MINEKSNVKVICSDCGIEFETTYDTYRTTKNKANKVWRCKKCRSIYRSNMMREREANRSEEEKKSINVKRSKTMKDVTSKVSPEEWKLRHDKAKSSMTQEEINNINKNISSGLKRFFENENDSEKEKRSEIRKSTWANKPKEEIEESINKRKETLSKLS